MGQALRSDVSGYDTAYFLLAQYLGAPLATLDKRLRRAATQCNIPLFRP